MAPTASWIQPVSKSVTTQMELRQALYKKLSPTAVSNLGVVFVLASATGTMHQAELSRSLDFFVVLHRISEGSNIKLVIIFAKDLSHGNFMRATEADTGESYILGKGRNS
ncbi:hypothetical protein ETB97_001922 [Aspergillus alliaceus]|uniref:Uncharacterized protein n=1 Tax=Petromyces alliaceus TaxID=209559 RepID=A0A8H6AF11_PETAA|nr:hypothetical protein ETB97_001922 [Aspergillus burnettii]